MITYLARNGEEILLRSEADCAAAIRGGSLHGGSMIMDCHTGRWMRASEHVELSALLSRIAVEAEAPPLTIAERAATSSMWLPAIALPALIARALHADAGFVLALTLTCALALFIAGIAARRFITSHRARWWLSVLLPILAFAAGAGSIIAKMT